MGVEQEAAPVPLPESPQAREEHVVVTRAELEEQPAKPISRQAEWEREIYKYAAQDVLDATRNPSLAAGISSAHLFV
jgi:hypothetical protein